MDTDETRWYRGGPGLATYAEQDRRDGHILPQEDWDRVAAEVARLDVEGFGLGVRAIGADSPLVTYVYEAKAYGGSQNPNINVLHSIESPLRAGYARTLTGPAYFGGSSAGVSSHYVVDPVDTCQGVPEGRVAYHVGRGNPRTIATEQSGYARFSRAEWTTADGLAQLDRVARLWADINRRRPLIQLRWLSDAELVRAWNNPGSVGGCSWHQQFMRVIGGTSHHDPCQSSSGMQAYPFDLLMAKAIAYRGGGPIDPPGGEFTGGVSLEQLVDSTRKALG